MGDYEQSPDYGGPDPKPWPWLWVAGVLVFGVSAAAYRLL